MSKMSNKIRFCDVCRILKLNGFTQNKSRGTGHTKFLRDGRHVSIPERGVNAMLWRRIVKENNINTDI